MQPGKQERNQYLIPFILVTSLFFLWGIANSLNGTLIKHFQTALDLNRAQAGIVDSAFYIGYFVMALPAGFFMKRYGYKRGIIVGLLLYALGAALFYPAAEARVYGFFLFNLFVIASGLGFLETAANSYVTVLGDAESAERRINFAQSFNGVSIILGPLIGGLFIFSSTEYSREMLAQMPLEQAEAIRSSEALAVQMPYVVIAVVVLVVAGLFAITRMPEVHDSHDEGGSFWQLFRHRHLTLGVLAQFFNVGAQACLWGYFVDIKLALAREDHLGIVKTIYRITEGQTPTQIASFHASFALAVFMAGRFIGTWLMGRVRPNRVLGLYGIAAALLVAVVMSSHGLTAVLALTAIYFFQSIMFPTIFALATKNLGEQAKLGSSLVIMAIVGGAILPPLLGWLSRSGMQLSLVIPACCFAFIAYYGMSGYRVAPVPSQPH